MAKLQALIWDVDGTLADTERDGHRVAFNRAFVDAGLDWHWSVELYGQLLAIAGGKERIRFYLQQFQPTFRGPDPLDDWIAHLHAAKTQHYKQVLQEGLIPLRPGVQRLLLEAQLQGIRLAIATTSALDNVLALLETTLGGDRIPWFEVIAAGDIVPAKKPAPDIYHYVLDRLGLPPSACLVIEDSDQGLTAAHGAGLTTVVTTNGYTATHNFAAATLVVDQLGEPTQPFQVLQGNPGPATYFDLALAAALLLDP